MLWTSSASAWRTPEKVWLMSAGTSVSSALLGVRGEAERDPRLMDLLEGLLDRGLGRPLGLEALVEVLAGDARCG